MPKNPFRKNLIINKNQQLLNQINALEINLKLLSDDELRIKNLNLQKQYDKTQKLNSLIAQSFAITREASIRTLGLRHFDVQLLGGLALNSGKIAEMKTGEGKTLVATLPTVLNTSKKLGVHIVTVNDYLANRDQVSMGQIYRFLGLKTGLIKVGMTSFERKKNYSADITYVTNYELVFDFLRDNMVESLDNSVIPGLNYCIIDEVDSILIDEAQTPLLIANPDQTGIDDTKYIITEEITNYLKPTIHFDIDKKNKNIILNSKGNQQIETILTVQNLYDPQDPWIPYILNALRAKYLYFNNKQYIIQNNRIVIVDEFTGRIMPDRRWSEGLHQAVEAKEKLPIRASTETMASITYQNFFLAYSKLSGMTGTAKTSELEFEKIYKLSVEQIPTARPNLRKDLPDFIYRDIDSKWAAIAEECYKVAITGQPILIGTTTIEKSEVLALLLDEYKIRYQLLNAKPENVRKESEIISQAGKKGTITIATNMAGRGTDIILGGNIEFKTQKILYYILVITKSNIKKNRNFNIFTLFTRFEGISQKFLSVLLSVTNNNLFLNLSDVNILRILRENDRIFNPISLYQCSVKFLVNELLIFNKKNQKQDNKIVKNLGGLYVIGTERNDSRRIDNQLRGRCGRQGDPGTSRFFLSLDDDLLVLFGTPKIQGFVKNQLFDDSPIESKFVVKSLDTAQKRVEERSYEARKNLFEYDDILNKQRRITYVERQKILRYKSIQPLLIAYSEQVLEKLLSLKSFSKSFKIESLFGKRINIRAIRNSLKRKNIIKKYLFIQYWNTYTLKFYDNDSCKPENLDSIQRQRILTYFDLIWKEQLQRMGLLREAVGWRGYGQKNPLYEYQADAYRLFKELNITLRQLVIFDLIRTTVL